MKRTVSVFLIIMLFLSGCGLTSGQGGADKGSAHFSEGDSKVKFDIYPEASGFEILGGFQRPEYQNLTDTQKSIYIALDNAAYLMTTGFIDLGNCTARDVSQAYFAMRNDRPEYFWLPSEYSLRTTGTRYELCLAKTADGWRYSKQQRADEEAELKKLLTEFASAVDPAASAYERELSAHDWLCERIKYDRAALADSDSNHHAWSIVGAINRGRAVCEGYSRAMQVLMFMMGIDCALITGTTAESHMWNTVKINGSWYHVDLTSDDGDNGIYHFFFNVTDQYILKSRAVDPLISELSDSELSTGRFNTFLPRCTDISQNFHVLNSVYIGTSAEIEPTVVSLICDAVRSGRRSVEFAVSPEMDFVFGQHDAARVFRLERCISAANAELSRSQQLRSYSYGGVNGALGFMITW